MHLKISVTIIFTEGIKYIRISINIRLGAPRSVGADLGDFDMGDWVEEW